jgi:hypothetical protein
MERLLPQIEDDDVRREFVGAVMSHSNMIYLSFAAESRRRKRAKESQEDNEGSSKGGTFRGSLRKMYKRMAEGSDKPRRENLRDAEGRRGYAPVPSPPWATVHHSH